MGLDICHVKLSVKTEDTIEYFTVDEFEHNPLFLENHKHLITSLDDDGTPKPVIYYVDKAHLRKQVTDRFINEFENDKLYFELETVRKAKLLLKANTDEHQHEIERTFQSNFIDNFIEGESVFFITW